MERGSTYYQPTDETTEWEDILIKKGIMAPKTKVQNEVFEMPSDVEMRQTQMEKKSLKELDELDDEYDDDAAIRKIREKRLAEMKMQAARNKYGFVQPISKDEWKTEVNEASKSSWVVVYLFDHAVEACKLLDQLLLEVAIHHPDVKFVSIPSQICMENWPSRNLPTIFIYGNGELQAQLLTMKQLGGAESNVNALEQVLQNTGVFGLLPSTKQVDEDSD